MSEKANPLPPPLCKAILICERAEILRATRLINLWGVTDILTVPSFPGFTRPFVVFLRLTDAEGERPVWVEVHDLRDSRVLGRTPPDRVPFPGRTQSIIWTLACPPLPLPSPGEYDLVAFCDGVEIDRLKFAAVASPVE
jgi:hypothetical protein